MTNFAAYLQNMLFKHIILEVSVENILCLPHVNILFCKWLGSEILKPIESYVIHGK